MPLELPAAAAAAHPIRIRNFDETGFKVCALHSFKHLHTSCPGCACQCKASKIYVKLPAAQVNFIYYSDSEDDSQDSSPEDMFFRKQIRKLPELVCVSMSVKVVGNKCNKK